MENLVEMQKCFESCTSCNVAETKPNIIVKKVPERTEETKAESQGLGSRRQQEVLALHAACLSNDSAKCEEILRSNPSLVDAKDAVQRTPLHAAAFAGSIDAASVLLRYGADLQATNRASKTPLLVAAENKRGDMMRLLLMVARNRQAKGDASRPDSTIRNQSLSLNSGFTSARTRVGQEVCKDETAAVSSNIFARAPLSTLQASNTSRTDFYNRSPKIRYFL
uniref:Uncharacterized protein n=1 Tax=Guillardia theta TaxID=55529 RepID=A0A7S4NMY2_GUITH|mmetsp:Transcript_25608/g.84583  ORF Transcript_25608/g.84583 Transcript_25608/m.84583 type:complete len:223 (+) Transcript_25608:77-745(+)